MGTPDVGLAAAGWAARAQDASTVFKNPAGMSFLEKSELQAGVQAIYGNIGFSPNSQTTTTGGDGGNPVGWAPGGSLFYAHKLTPDLSVGMGVFSYFGGSVKYDDSWVGRYYNQESTLLGFTFMPAVSYRITKWLSVGAGLNATYSKLKEKVAVRNFDRPDGQITVEDDAVGWGANVGVLVEPFKGTRIGVDYMSQMKLKFSDVPQFSGIGPGLDAILRNRNAYNASLDLDVISRRWSWGAFTRSWVPNGRSWPTWAGSSGRSSGKWMSPS
jgi:long-chain fatty acid transport protein